MDSFGTKRSPGTSVAAPRRPLCTGMEGIVSVCGYLHVAERRPATPGLEYLIYWEEISTGAIGDVA